MFIRMIFLLTFQLSIIHKIFQLNPWCSIPWFWIQCFFFRYTCYSVRLHDNYMQAIRKSFFCIFFSRNFIKYWPCIFIITFYNQNKFFIRTLQPPFFSLKAYFDRRRRKNAIAITKTNKRHHKHEFHSNESRLDLENIKSSMKLNMNHIVNTVMRLVVMEFPSILLIRILNNRLI